MAQYRPLRRGDLVEAKGCTGKHKQPDGTVGKIIIAPSQPTIPRSLYVEWMVPNQPPRKSWHHETELVQLS